MTLDPLQYLLGFFSGGLIGFSLGMFGGGGSILAVPLMVYLVGVPQPHMAIGTSAIAVAINAVTGLSGHIRRGSVKWRCAMVFSAAGILGALVGSTLGKALDGQRLLFLFALVMLVVAILMFRRRDRAGLPDVQCNQNNIWKVLGTGAGTGTFSGFFGIGGGFLIVPGLVLSTDIPIVNAIGTSLVAVATFGLTTAISYSVSGLVDWPLAAVLVAGGFLGGAFGSRTAFRLSRRNSLLGKLFAGLISLVSVYMLWKSAGAWL